MKVTLVLGGRKPVVAEFAIQPGDRRRLVWRFTIEAQAAAKLRPPRANEPERGAHRDWPSARYAWYFVTLLMLANAVAVLDRVVLGLLVQPMEHDLGIGDSRMGLLQGFAFSIFYGGLGIPIGILADRWSRRGIVSIGVGLWSVATAACGFASSFGWLFLARIGVGVGEATIGPAGASLIADFFPPLVRPKAYGMYIMGTSLGTGLAFLLGASALAIVTQVRGLALPLTGAMHDWQIVFLLVSLPGIVVAAIFRLTIREPVRRGRAAAGRLSFKPLFAHMGQQKVAYAGLMAGCALNVLSIYAIIGWYATLFIRIHHWSAPKIGTAIGMFAVPGGMLSAVASGFIIAWMARRGREDAPVLLALLAPPAFLILGTAACLIPNPLVAFAIFAVMAFFTNWSSSAVLTGLNQITPNALRGQVVALYTLIAGIVSLGFGPTSVGLLTDYVVGRDHVDWALAFVLAVCSILGAIILLASRKAFRRSAIAAQAEP